MSKNLIALSIFKNKSFKKYRQVYWTDIQRSLQTEFAKTLFSSLLQVKDAFL
jgi:hypothetical protein